jgi:DNA-binding NarL/FixJ family response regulator
METAEGLAPRREPIRIIVVDDQELFRRGLIMLLSVEDGIDVVGEASDGVAATELAATAVPDVVLMDVRMPGVDGIEATRAITSGHDPSPRVLVLTTFDLDDVVYDALRAGASGFLLKDASEDRLTTAIRVISDGGSLFAPSVTRRLIEEFAHRNRPSPPPALDGLTEREVDVLRQVARGLSNTEIATTLFVTENTVKTHVARVLRKLGIRDRVQAVVVAYESGLVIPSAETDAQQRANSPYPGAS